MGPAKTFPMTDELFKAPARLSILAFLSTAEAADFTLLRDEVGLTSGNLSTHLTKLEDAGYVKIEKSFQNKRPRTVVEITQLGSERFLDHIERMEAYYTRFRKMLQE